MQDRSDNYYETRLVILETTTKHIEQKLNALNQNIMDIRVELTEGFRDINNHLFRNLYFTIVGFITILAVMAHGFHWY